MARRASQALPSACCRRAHLPASGLLSRRARTTAPPSRAPLADRALATWPTGAIPPPRGNAPGRPCPRRPATGQPTTQTHRVRLASATDRLHRRWMVTSPASTSAARLPLSRQPAAARGLGQRPRQASGSEPSPPRGPPPVIGSLPVSSTSPPSLPPSFASQTPPPIQRALTCSPHPRHQDSDGRGRRPGVGLPTARHKQPRITPPPKKTPQLRSLPS